MSTRPTDAAVADLSAVVDAARRDASPLGFFAALYRQITVAVARAADDGVFADGARMDLLAAQLVGRYTAALAAWRDGHRTPRTWKAAFAAADRREVPIATHLALGFTAHVNADLPVCSAALAPGDAITGLEPDFTAINDLVAAFIDATQNAIGPFSPRLAELDALGGSVDEGVAGFVVDRARDDAWRHAVVLAHLPEPLRDDAAALLDGRGAFLARLIADPPAPFGAVAAAVAASESDDVAAIIGALGALRARAHVRGQKPSAP